jgi:hypothetical protein
VQKKLNTENQMKLRIVTLLLLLISQTDIFAQHFFLEGFIVMKSNDTLYGEIKEKDNFSVFFRRKNETYVATKSANQLKSYSVEGVNRISATISNKANIGESQYFLKERVNGYLSLYELIKSEGKFSELVVQFPDKKFMQLLGKDAWILLKNKMLDCQDEYFIDHELSAKYFDYNLPYIERIVTSYNQCIKPNAETKKKRVPFEYKLGFFAGISKNNITYTFNNTNPIKNPFNPPNGQLTNYNFVPFGIYFTAMPRKKLSFSTELQYNQYKGTLTGKIVASSTHTYLLTIENKFLDFALLTKYTVLDGQVRGYLKAGITADYNIQISGYEKYDNNGETNVLAKKSLGIGYTFGIGVEKNIFKTQVINAELRYYYHTVVDELTQVGYFNSLQFVVGMSIN